jgi:hypothetical protein
MIQERESKKGTETESPEIMMLTPHSTHTLTERLKPCFIPPSADDNWLINYNPDIADGDTLNRYVTGRHAWPYRSTMVL